MIRRLVPVLLLLWSAVFLIGVGGCATYYAWTSGYHPDEFYWAKTSDDWTLALYRYKPQRPDITIKTPVILCQGLVMNAFLWDLKEE